MLTASILVSQDFIKHITIKHLDLKKLPQIYYIEPLMPISLMKNGVLILLKKRFLEQVKRFISALYLIFMTDFLQELKEHGMSQSMSRVSRCINNGPMEGWQGLIKEMRVVLYPNVNSYEDMEEAFKATIEYYINYDPQERFNGKTTGQVRREAKDNPENIISYPIKQDKRYKNFWKKIDEKKNQLA